MHVQERLRQDRPVTAQPLTDGELWSRAQLKELLAARFTHRALAQFLAASERRARDERHSRPEVARRELLWAAAGAGAWLTLAQIGVAPFRGRRRAGLAGWAATMLMLDWHLGMLETPDGRPRNLGPADAATLLRAWLVPAVAHDPRAGLCLLGYVTDAVDGPLARATAPTRLGRDLEGLVDAVFAVAVLRGARRRDRLGTAATIGESVRLLAGIAYAVGATSAEPRHPTHGSCARHGRSPPPALPASCWPPPAGAAPAERSSWPPRRSAWRRRSWRSPECALQAERRTKRPARRGTVPALDDVRIGCSRRPLRERRVGVHRRRDLGQRGAVRQPGGELGDRLAAAGGSHRRAHQPSARISDQHGEAIGLTADDRAVELGVVRAGDGGAAPPSAPGLGLGHADARDFGSVKVTQGIVVATVRRRWKSAFGVATRAWCAATWVKGSSAVTSPTA